MVLVLVGFIATFIGTLCGSGGLINVPAMLLLGIPIHTVISSNKFSNTISSFSSFFVLLKNKTIQLKHALWMAPFSFLGGVTGGKITLYISAHTMQIVAICLLSFALLLNFLKKPTQKDDVTTKPKPMTFPAIFGIGMYDGMFGPGQGTLLMYTFLQQGLSYLKAMAFTRFQTFLSCLGAFITYVSSPYFNWGVALPLAVGSFLGAQLAVQLAPKLPKTYLVWLLRLVTFLLIAQLTYQLIQKSM